MGSRHSADSKAAPDAGEPDSHARDADANGLRSRSRDAGEPDARAHEADSDEAESRVRDADEPDSRAAADAQLGRSIAGYRLDELLGVGGTAAVYRAVGPDGEPFALKVLHRALAGDARARKRFLREGRIAEWLDHPRVVPIVATGETPDGTAYHVMGLREGVTLEKRRAAAPEGLPCETVVPWIDDLLSVLAAAHARGIIHRDVKPANLLLDRLGHVHVLDFGIMRLGGDHGDSSLVTRSGVLLGTVSFMPPEQALGRSEEIDARTDVWAVGATMFSLITGKLVHRARSMNEALVLAATQQAPPIRQSDPSVPKPLAAVIDRALAFDKTDRFADASTMRRALRRAVGLEPDAATEGADATASAVMTLPEESLTDVDRPARAVAGLPKPFSAGGRGRIAALVLLVAGGAAAWALARDPGTPTDLGIARGAPGLPPAGSEPATATALPATATALPATPTSAASTPPQEVSSSPADTTAAASATPHVPVSTNRGARPPVSSAAAKRPVSAASVGPVSTGTLPPF